MRLVEKFSHGKNSAKIYRDSDNECFQYRIYESDRLIAVGEEREKQDAVNSARHSLGQLEQYPNQPTVSL